MRNLFKVLALLASLFVSQAFIYATQGSFGSEIFTDSNGNKQVYSKLALQPEFSVWKIGVGLDLQVYLDENGNVKEDDWNSWEDVANKILYVRYAQKGDPLYINFGGINSATIGHGIIFNRYSNMMRYPEVKKTGLLLDINRPTWGIETINTNLIKQEVVGGRFYFRPFYNSGIFLIDKVAFGLSAGTDVDPDGLSISSNDAVSVVAVDMELPLLDNPILSSKFFADVAQMQLGDVYLSNHNFYSQVENSTKTARASNNGTGFMAGFVGKLLIFDYKVVYKSLDNNFVDGYFDTFYEIDRANYKADRIANSTTPKKEGYYGELGYTFMKKISFMASYEDLKNPDINNKIYPWVHAQLNVDKSLLANKFFFNFSYDKKNAQTWEQIQDVNSGNALIRTEFGYAVGDSVLLVMVKEKTFDANGKEVVKTKIETRVIF
jgi:hypothetical protein